MAVVFYEVLLDWFCVPHWDFSRFKTSNLRPAYIYEIIEGFGIGLVYDMHQKVMIHS